MSGKKKGKAALAAKEPFLPLVRALAEAYQAFERFDTGLLREHGLTGAQADVVFTLGNTEGMTLTELGRRTLITKGTLTGVVDRLEGKGLVGREDHHSDRRCFLVRLTPKGDDLFQRVFPSHVAHYKERFRGFGETEMREAKRLLDRLAAIF